MLREPATRGPGFCRAPGTDPAPFGPAVQPPPPFPLRRSQLRASRGPRCTAAPPLRIGGPSGSSGAALAQMCWGPARAPVPSANSPDQTAPPAPSWRAPWRTPLAAPNPAAAPGAAPARLERSWRPGDSRFLVPPTSGGGCGGRYRELPPPPSPPRTSGVNSYPAGLARSSGTQDKGGKTRGRRNSWKHSERVVTQGRDYFLHPSSRALGMCCSALNPRSPGIWEDHFFQTPFQQQQTTSLSQPLPTVESPLSVCEPCFCAEGSSSGCLACTPFVTMSVPFLSYFTQLFGLTVLSAPKHMCLAKALC